MNRQNVLVMVAGVAAMLFGWALYPQSVFMPVALVLFVIYGVWRMRR